MRRLEEDEPELFALHLRLRHFDNRLAQIENDYEKVAVEVEQTVGSTAPYAAQLLSELRSEMRQRIRVISNTDGAAANRKTTLEEGKTK
jgi:hypothetical protein